MFLDFVFATIAYVNTLVGFFREVRLELSKVVWPKRQEVIKLTLIVIAISFIFGAFTGGLDYIFTKVLETLVSH